VLVGITIASSPALAKSKGGGAKRIAVLPPTDGTPKDAVITAKIAKAIKQKKLQPVTGGPVKKAIATGVPSSDGDWIALARKLKVHGVIEPIMVSKRKVEVVVHNGADGSVAAREEFTAKGPPAKLAAAVAAGLWKKLGSAIKGTEPPKKDEAPPALPPSEPVAGGEKPESAAPAAKETAETMPSEEGDEDEAAAKATLAKEKPETPPGMEGDEDEEFEKPKAKPGKDKSRKPRMIEVEIGGRLLERLFEFTPASAGRSYHAQFLPVVQGRAAWFPITYAGIFLSGEVNPALQSDGGDSRNPAFPTGTRELVVGAQGRYPLSVGTLGLSAAYFQHMFILGDTSNTNDTRRQDLAWPDTAYQGVRVAANARFYLWSFLQVGAEGAYRLVTNPGEGGLRVRSPYYFPNGKTTFGFEGSAFASVGIVSWLELRVGIDYRRYVFGELRPGSDNANQTSASGATDQYMGFTLGVVGVYGGR
jgi:hypothetical protein